MSISNTSTLTIGILQPEDFDAARELLVRSYIQYKDSYERVEDWLTYENDLRTAIDLPDIHRIIAAKLENQLVGILLLFENSALAYGKPELNIDTLIIRMLGVAPEARGHGIAYQLLNEVLRYAQARGDNAIHLHTTDKMSDAIKLYERYGYVRDYEKEFYRFNYLVKCYRYDIHK